jgi:hypothetical protein
VTMRHAQSADRAAAARRFTGTTSPARFPERKGSPLSNARDIRTRWIEIASQLQLS